MVKCDVCKGTFKAAEQPGYRLTKHHATGRLTHTCCLSCLTVWTRELRRRRLLKLTTMTLPETPLVYHFRVTGRPKERQTR